jgi:hypothetical protein
MAGPSQPSVTDEVWDDERVKSFLDMEAVHDESRDFHVLQKAYRGMRPEDFERFLRFFLDDGRDMNATDKRGRTLWDIIKDHRQGADFIQVKEKLAN